MNVSSAIVRKLALMWLIRRQQFFQITFEVFVIFNFLGLVVFLKCVY